MDITPGCYIDGGQYNNRERIGRVLDTLELLDNPDNRTLRLEYERLTDLLDAHDAGYDSNPYDLIEQLSDLEDSAIQWINELLPEGWWAGWDNGDFFIADPAMLTELDR